MLIQIIVLHGFDVSISRVRLNRYVINNVKANGVKFIRSVFLI